MGANGVKTQDAGGDAEVLSGAIFDTQHLHVAMKVEGLRRLVRNVGGDDDDTSTAALLYRPVRSTIEAVAAEVLSGGGDQCLGSGAEPDLPTNRDTRPPAPLFFK